MPQKILIVDDESDISETLAIRFQKAGFDVSLAFDGQEGLTKAKEVVPDIIIMDEMMPKMNGFKVCALLKADSRFQKIPIVMFTARSQDEIDTTMAREVGFDDYVNKLIDFEDLLEKIKGLTVKN
ncbi:MAG: response regulator transcription factor [Candidatus Omnitrophota bacterium]